MTQILLIRHGQADYDCLRSRTFPVICAGYAPLTEKGIYQATAVANNKRLNGAEIIVSSPFTRALQTAAIISHKTGLKISVEFDLHEWLPDTNFKIRTESEFNAALHSFIEHDGNYCNEDFTWEQISDIKKRTMFCLKKYSNYKKLIAITHEEVITAITGRKSISNCEIVEFNYD